MLSLLVKFYIELFDLTKYSLAFVANNVIIIISFIFIYVSIIYLNIGKIKAYIEKSNMKAKSSVNIDTIKSLLITYHEQQIDIIKQILDNPDITHIIDNNKYNKETNTYSASETISEAESNSGSESETETETETDSDTGSDIELNTKPDTELDIKLDTKPNTKPDEKPNTNPDEKPNTKPDEKPNTY